MALEYLNMTGRRVLLFITIFLFISFKSFSAVFTVTSNADSGPGTLREALTLAAANGSAEKDYIYFNLPDLSEAGRTITMLTQLPDVSSNLIIDGSTQPGDKFGISDAKVALFQTADYTQEVSGLFIHDQTDVAVLGLYIKCATYTITQTNYFWQGINIENSKNIQIGQAGKGNIIVGFYFPIATNFDHKSQTCENISLKDNICDIEIDGITTSPNLQYNQGAYFFFLAGQIDIGGTTGEGNLFANGLTIYQWNSYDDSPPANFLIRNNKVGVNYLVNDIIPSCIGLNIGSGSPAGKNTITIADNELAGFQGPLFASNCIGKLTILRNYIGIDKTLTHKLNIPGAGIAVFYYQGDVQIGTTDPKDANVVGYCKPLQLTETLKVSFNKNSFFCAKDFYPIYSYSLYSPLPQASITNVTNNSIGGTATPHSSIELFYADDCGTCSPKTYFASTIADNNGKWVYNTHLTGSVLATATINGTTSEYTQPSLSANVDDSQINKHTPDCNGSNGSITNIRVTSFTQPTDIYTYTWTNSQNQVVGHNLDLNEVPEETYTLKITGPGCGTITTAPITLKSKTITIDLTNIHKSNAGCNGPTGSITGITAPNATHYQWINKINNQIASNSSDLRDVGPGTYQLIASNDFSCSEKSPEYTIDATPATVYPNYNANINNSCTGENNGSITVIPTDNLVKTARWIDAEGQPAGTGLNVPNLKPGTYKVYFTDANGCETLYPHDFTVNEIDPLQIVANSETRTDDQCGLNTGGIKNIQVKGGTQPYTYLWLNVAGEHLVTSQDLTDVGAGDYTLQVQDAGGCGVMASRIYTVLNENSSIDAPVIAPLQLCAPGEALLSVSSPSAGNTYRLYDSQTSTQYQDEQTNGIFKIKANPNSIYYISKVSGQCESERTQAQITISLSAIDIPNAFTPNGDGKNDYWKINNAQNYPQAIVQIFTRYGQKVFESKGYSVPFDGTYNGTKLPSGVYYYILNLGKSCNLLSGSLSIIR